MGPWSLLMITICCSSLVVDAGAGRIVKGEDDEEQNRDIDGDEYQQLEQVVVEIGTVVGEVVGEGDEVVQGEDDEEQDHDMEVAGGPEVGVVDSDYGSCSSFSGY